MPVNQNFAAYQESISHELTATQDRIRHLIGALHWQTDGEHKESLVRNLLRTHAPEAFRIGRGFVCYPSRDGHLEQRTHPRSSRQLDVLITSRNKPTLYKEGDLVFVTADAVEAVIEVKTKLYERPSGSVGLAPVLQKLAQQAQHLRQHSIHPFHCWVGLFVFELGDLKHETILKTLQEVTDGKLERVINCMVFGPNTFIRFWRNGEDINSAVVDSVWHSYELQHLAPTYFIGNCISTLSRGFPDTAVDAWFPVEGTKEVRRKFYAALKLNEPVMPFDQG